MNKYFVIGGAGMIGSHFVDYLLSNSKSEKVTIFDNFSSGREWHYVHHLNDSRLSVIKRNVEDTFPLSVCMQGHDVVIHLASNPDISKAITDPSIDFHQGTALTNSVLEAMRISGVKRLLYASGSGVYGDLGYEEAKEDKGNLLPISTYGASKLASEVLIHSYCHMFDMTGFVFRFANVVGPRQTHGVSYDFTKRLLQNHNELSILGSGWQSKSYIHVEDVVNAVMMVNNNCRNKFDIFNVATEDYITVNDIINYTAWELGLNPENIKITRTNSFGGWKGDVPIVRLNSDKIRSLGWYNAMTSDIAIREAVKGMIPYIKAGKM